MLHTYRAASGGAQPLCPSAWPLTSRPPPHLPPPPPPCIQTPRCLPSHPLPASRLFARVQPRRRRQQRAPLPLPCNAALTGPHRASLPPSLNCSNGAAWSFTDSCDFGDFNGIASAAEAALRARGVPLDQFKYKPVCVCVCGWVGGCGGGGGGG